MHVFMTSMVIRFMPRLVIDKKMKYLPFLTIKSVSNMLILCYDMNSASERRSAIEGYLCES